jgi:hypothetical protein
MKKIALATLFFIASSSAYGAPLRQRPQQRQPQTLQPAVRPNAPVRPPNTPVRPNATVRPAQRQAVVRDALLGFYVNKFQQEGEVTPELFAKILPSLQQFVQDRFEISRRRQLALNQLRQAIARDSSEDELKRFVREFDTADAEFQANQEKFLNNVDPLLNARQQAKLRILQNMADNRIRQLLDAVQNPNAQRRPDAPQPPEN